MATISVPMSYRASCLLEVSYNQVSETFKKWAILIVPAVLVYIFVFMTMTQGTCACTHSNTIPGFIEDDQGMNLSTAWSRYYTDAEVCSAYNTPCMVYASLPENSLSEVFINFHVNLDS